MIPTLAGWAAELLPRGVVFTHPDGPDVARVFYAERVRPLRRLGPLVRGIVATTPGFVATAWGAPERLVTADGEHAAAITVIGTQHGRPAQRDFGFVFGDDFFSSIGGLCLRPGIEDELGAVVRDLTRRDVHALGVRRRRFEYAAPGGWQPLAQRLAVQWLPPGYPANQSWLVVYPANPIAIVDAAATPLTVIDNAFAYLDEIGYAVEAKGELEEFVVTTGLRGHRQRVRARRREGAGVLVLEVAILCDARYAYVVEFWCHDPVRWAEQHAAFESVVASIVPVPVPMRLAGSGQAFTHWMD